VPALAHTHGSPVCWSLTQAHVQLLLRMTSQIEGKRLFFVSQVAADVIRECLVLDRYVWM
jgi:hypothetical protein